jgi:hypothetical protein
MTDGFSDKARQYVLFAILVSASMFLLLFVNRFYPVSTWLLWRYIGYWFVILFWATSCLAGGHAVLSRMFRGALSMHERFTFSMAIGVLIFGLGVFFLGLVHLLNSVTFFVLPVGLLISGGEGLISEIVDEGLLSFIHPRRTEARTVVAIDWRMIPVLTASGLALALLYFQELSPEVFSFDARWYHIPMAQRYALSGRIGPFEEGFWPGAWPHLLSYLYTWAFLTPGVLLFDRLELCAHMEFALFLLTLAQIPAFVRCVVPSARVGWTWATLLAFPCIYVYDGNLNGGADHVAGFWAIPIALSMWRLWHSYRPTNALLCAACLGGAVLTKYTAAPVVITAGLAVLMRGLWLGLVRRSRVAWSGTGVLVLSATAITAPHWLKNWIWYGDPIYPMLRNHLTVHPWNPDVPSQLEILAATARPGSLTMRGLAHALTATWAFSFVPNDWEFLHRDVPVFGSLFTLTLPCLLFLRGARRLWWGYLWVMSVVFSWYILSHYDRYLQAVVPAMAAVTAACLTLCWQHGGLARTGVVLLVGTQVMWGSDVPFIRTHNQIFDSPLRQVALFMASGFERKPNRLRMFEPLGTVGKSLPEDAVVLAHDVGMILGIDRNWRTDRGQSKFSYARLRSPAAIHAELLELGVTHLVWPDRSANTDSLAGDLAFFNYAARYTRHLPRVESYNLASLPAVAPDDSRSDYVVAHFGCGEVYRAGLYRLSQLTLPMMNPGSAPAPERDVTDRAGALEQADFVVFDPSCNSGWSPSDPFVQASERGSERLYVRVRH